MHFTRNQAFLVVGVGFIIILIGAYFLFQQHGEGGLPAAPVATTTEAAATSTEAGSSAGASAVQVRTNAPSAADIAAFTAHIDVLFVSVGEELPPVELTLPEHSDGKVVTVALRPLVATSTTHTGVLLATTLHPSGSTYTIRGIRIKNATDPVTGEKFAITPGKYVFLTTLWDKSPFTAAGTYGSIAGVNAIQVQSSPVTITK